MEEGTTEAERAGAKVNPYEDPTAVSEFAYYIAFTDAIRVSQRENLSSGHLESRFREYSERHPLHPDFNVRI